MGFVSLKWNVSLHESSLKSAVKQTVEIWITFTLVRALRRFIKSYLFSIFERIKKTLSWFAYTNLFIFLQPKEEKCRNIPQFYLQSLDNKQNGFKKNGWCSTRVFVSLTRFLHYQLDVGHLCFHWKFRPSLKKKTIVAFYISKSIVLIVQVMNLVNCNIRIYFLRSIVLSSYEQC